MNSHLLGAAAADPGKFVQMQWYLLSFCFFFFPFPSFFSSPPTLMRTLAGALFVELRDLALRDWRNLKADANTDSRRDRAYVYVAVSGIWLRVPSVSHDEDD